MGSNSPCGRRLPYLMTIHRGCPLDLERVGNVPYLEMYQSAWIVWVVSSCSRLFLCFSWLLASTEASHAFICSSYRYARIISDTHNFYSSQAKFSFTTFFFQARTGRSLCPSQRVYFGAPGIGVQSTSSRKPLDLSYYLVMVPSS